MVEGRIIKGVGGLYEVDTPNGVYACKARGIFRKDKITPLVGDFVDISILDDKEKTGAIEKIRDRKTALIRPRIANVDHAMLVFAAQSPDLNLDLMDRFLVLCEFEHLEITICINKIDMVSERLADFLPIKAMYEKAGYSVLFTSAVTNENKALLIQHLEGKVTVFAGPSGAGKSSLVNSIVPHVQMETGELSKKIARGKHTTRHTQLIQAFDNSYIADTPGFTSLYFEDMEKEALADCFPEFRGKGAQCRFADCSHINEPECAVKESVACGEIAQVRYDRYVALYEELQDMRR